MRINWMLPINDELKSAHNRLMSILEELRHICTQFDMPAILPYEEFKEGIQQPVL